MYTDFSKIDINKIPERIDAIVFDFDGVFTDNAVYVDENGLESVRCSRSDGMGVRLLRDRKIPMLVVSKERNPVVAARCKKLLLPLQQGIDDKINVLQQWFSTIGVAYTNAIYLGNDINDRDCLEYVGCGVGPNDSHPDILSSLDIRL